jgi:hypothetical protein
MRITLAACLLVAACSTTAPAPDDAPGDVARAPEDTATPADTRDAVASDDAPAVVDAAPDAGPVRDDATAAVDVPTLVEASADAALATDVNDAGSFPDLDARYAPQTIRVLYRTVPASSSASSYDAVAVDTRSAATCSSPRGASGVLRFSLYACDAGGFYCQDLVGQFPATGAPTIFVFDATGSSITARTATATQGARYVVGSTYVRNYHVQFNATPMVGVSVPGVTGIAGRTAAADLGDLWLLACPEMP